MSKDTFYFPHDYHARTDHKIVKVMMRHGVAGVGVFWCLVEMLYEEGGELPIEYERISFELRTSPELVESIINDFGLFEINCEIFYSKSVIERLRKRQEKSDKARESVGKRWEGKGKRNANV
jgi:hypothetical protein